MKAHILATEAFRYTAEIRKLAVPAGSYSFAITSTWPGAKDPVAEQTAIQITLDAGGLMALRDLINAEVRPESGREGLDVSGPVDIAVAMTELSKQYNQPGDAMPHDEHSVTATPNAAPGEAA
jgi:hypothetical protein